MSVANLDELIARLDTVASFINQHGLVQLQQQALVYAGFLTDLQNEKIPQSEESDEMVGLVRQFCELVEVDFNLQKEGA